MTKIERYASILAVRAVREIVRCLPWKGVQVFGRILGELGYFLPGKYREITLSNLRLAFGSKMEKKELEAIARQAYITLGKILCEGMGSVRFSRTEMRELVELRGKENLELAMKKGKGVIGFSAHLGNFGLLGARLAVEGYPVNLIMRNPEVEQVAEMFLFCLRRHGIRIISSLPRRRAIVESLKCLQGNEIVCILGDQRELQGGVFVDFFGHPAGTATGPVVLAMRTGASIVPMFSLREPGDKHVGVIEPVFELRLSGDNREDIHVNTARLTKLIEGYVTRFPSQWFWLHQRWKLK